MDVQTVVTVKVGPAALRVYDTIAGKDATQMDIAAAYAGAILSGEEIDWPAINQAILDRYGYAPRALKRIKKMAWALVEVRRRAIRMAAP